MARKEPGSFSQSMETDHIFQMELTVDIPTSAGIPHKKPLQDKEPGLWDQVPVSWVTLSKSVHLPVLHFLHLYNRNRKSLYLLGLMWEWNELTNVGKVLSIAPGTDSAA